MTGCRANFTCLALLVLLILPAWGAGAESTADAGESEGERLNKVELFLGNTQNGSSNGASIGVSYERRLSQLFGFGGYVEYAGGDFATSAVGANFVLHPHAGWIVKLSPGVEFDDHSTNFQFRLGAAYDFEITPSWSLAPEFNVEFVDGERNLIYGLSAGYAF